MPETTDRDREEAMEELAIGIVALCIHEGPITVQIGEIKELIRDYDSRIRAEAKAEALREAAERLCKICVGELDPNTCKNCPDRAAILADEPNKEE